MSCSCVDADRCGCCEGTRAITPRDTFNRPGLSVLHRRIGDHHDFLETMLSAIARTWIDVETGGADPHGRPRRERTFPLRDLRTRAPDDPTIALLDLWAIVGDILSFYSERTATEGYLRTATELMSVSELARLVGYERRPGVSASAFLAFTVDDARTGPLVVPAGARVQSLPGPGETPVFFETDVPLSANAAWNELLPRRHRPTYLPRAVARSIPVIYFAGTATRLEPNMPLLLSYGNDYDDQELRFVSAVQEDYDNDRTRARLRPVKASEVRHLLELPQVFEPVDLGGLVRQLERPPSRPPSAPARLALSVRGTFGPGSSTVDRLFADFHPTAEGTLASARARARVTANPELRAIYALRVRASVYGDTSLPPANVDGVREAGGPDWPYEPDVPHRESRKVIDLDTTYDAIVPGSWVVIVRRAIGKEQEKDSPVQRVFVITRVARVETVSRIDYDTPAKVTRLELESSWLPADKRLSLRDIRPTVVFAVPEELALAEEPIIAPVCGGTIELDRLVDGLEPGRWLIVTGERAASVEVENAAGDAFSATGVPVSEVTMLADVRQDVLQVLDGEVVSPQAAAGKGRALPGDHVHTFLELAAPLAYCYVRDTMKIYGNVAQATHGETHAEPLGSGDPAQILQSFDLKNNPLTHIPAATPSGERSTLEVYVDGVRWHEAEDPFALGPRDRAYVTSRDHTEKTSVIFGDGETGARLPKGVENVRAVYRSGIGKPGNVRAGQLSLLVTRTDGLRGVTNPQRASGGADPDGVESTRARAPLAVGALDRLVSTSRLRRLRADLRRDRKGERGQAAGSRRKLRPRDGRGRGRHPDRPAVGACGRAPRGASSLRRPVPAGAAGRARVAGAGDRRARPAPGGLPLGDVAAEARSRARRPVRIRASRPRPRRVRRGGARRDARHSGRRLRRSRGVRRNLRERDRGGTGLARIGPLGHRRRTPADRGASGPRDRAGDRTRARAACRAAARTCRQPCCSRRSRSDHLEPRPPLPRCCRRFTRRVTRRPAIRCARCSASSAVRRRSSRTISGASTTAGSSRRAPTGSCRTSATWSDSRPAPEAGDPANLDVSDPRSRLRVLLPRRDVADTVRARRRRGTLALLEVLARDSAGWPARAVEFFTLLAWAQNLNHQRRWPLATVRSARHPRRLRTSTGHSTGSRTRSTCAVRTRR